MKSLNFLWNFGVGNIEKPPQETQKDQNTLFAIPAFKKPPEKGPPSPTFPLNSKMSQESLFSLRSLESPTPKF